MVLVSFLLVLAAAVTLVIGLLNTGLGLIYVSIACSVVAGAVLVAAVVRSRPRAELAGAGGAPMPLGASGGGGAATGAEPAVTVLPRSEPTESVRTVSAAADADDLDVTTVGAASDYEWPSEASPGAAELRSMAGDDFPIAEYDDLTVAEIVPLLSQLDPDELEIVLARERAGRDRSSIVARIEALVDEAAPAAPARGTKKATAKKAATKKATATTKRAAAKKSATASAKKSATRSTAKKTATKSTSSVKKSAAKSTAKKAATKSTAKKAATKSTAKKSAAKKATTAAKKTAKAAKRR